MVAGVPQQGADDLAAQAFAPVGGGQGGDEFVAVDVAGLLGLRVPDVPLLVPQAPYVEEAFGVDVGEDHAERLAQVVLGHLVLAHPAAYLLVAQEGDEGFLVL